MAFDNLPQFNDDMRRIAVSLPREAIVPFVKKITFDLFTKIVLRTPVDTGRARANWHVTIDAPSERRDLQAHDREGDQTLAEGQAALGGLKPFQNTFISNNVPYIVALEDGHSQQSPPGVMVALSVEEIVSQFSDTQGPPE